jgi:AAA15 family ATPase/GTPase
MIRGLTIQNFRNIRSLDYKPKDFNVILGNQGIGKTSLLEAIALTDATDREFHSILRRSYYEPSRIMELRELILHNFFAHRRDIESFRVKLEYKGSRNRLFEIWKTNEDMGRSLGMPNMAKTPYIFVFDSKRPTQIVPRAVPYGSVEQIHNALRNQVDQWPIHYVGPDHTTSVKVLSRHYNLLADHVPLGRTILSLIEHFSNVADINLVSIARHPTLMVKMKDRQEPVPLYGVSPSLIRMLSIIVFLLSTDRPFFMIDDIERGLTEPELDWLCWEVYQISAIRGIQVFLTTRRQDVVDTFQEHFSHNKTRLSVLDMASTRATDEVVIA